MPELPSPPPVTSPQPQGQSPLSPPPASQTSSPPTPTPNPEPTGNELAPAPATPPTAPVVPDTYTFAAPEGKTLDADAIAAFTPIAKELGLSQTAAQRLVDFYNTRAEEQAKVTSSAIAALGEKWMAEAKADPKLAPHLGPGGAISTDIGRMFDSVFAGDPATRAAFQESMNLTMSGNNPAFIRAFWAIAKHVNEGTHVSGAGPAETGQNPTGVTSRPSLAEAMYGHLNNRAS